MSEVMLKSRDYYQDKAKSDDKILLHSAVNNYLANARLQFPDVPVAVLKEKILKICKERYKPIRVKYFHSESKGNMTHEKGDFLEVLREADQHIRTPYGSAFVKPNVRKSLFSDPIVADQTERKVVKHDMMICESNLDLNGALMKHFKQLYIKVGINAISGVMLSNVTFKSSINYNSITSISRYGIMIGYAFVERLLGSNFYFKTEECVNNWIVNLIREYPGDYKINAVLNKYDLKLVDKDRLIRFFTHNLKKYLAEPDMTSIEKILAHLTPLKLTWLYYAGSLRNIFFDNESMRGVTSDLLNIKDKSESKYSKLGDLEDDTLKVFSLVLLADYMVDDDGKRIPKNKLEEYPDLIKHICRTYEGLEHKFSNLELLIDTFILINTMPNDVVDHKNMDREVALLSDTDSIIMTLSDWVEWYVGRKLISTESANIAGLFIGITCKILNHVFMTTAARMNLLKENYHMLTIENEYTYDLLFSTDISKHYAGLNSYKEGTKLPKPKLDIKGKNFVGSDLCNSTTGYIRDFIKDGIFKPIVEDKELTIESILRRIIYLEQTVRVSIEHGEHTYLNKAPIKSKESYKKPYSQKYAYFELWQQVFEAKYGKAYVNTKFRVVPINKITISNLKDTELPDDIKAGMERYFKITGRKYLESVYIPLNIDIPDVIRPITNYRKLIRQNSKPLHLIAGCFGINIPTFGNSLIMFSDYYESLGEEIYEQVRRERASGKS